MYAKISVITTLEICLNNGKRSNFSGPNVTIFEDLGLIMAHRWIILNFFPFFSRARFKPCGIEILVVFSL